MIHLDIDSGRICHERSRGLGLHFRLISSSWYLPVVRGRVVVGWGSCSYRLSWFVGTHGGVGGGCGCAVSAVLRGGLVVGCLGLSSAA